MHTKLAKHGRLKGPPVLTGILGLFLTVILHARNFWTGNFWDLKFWNWQFRDWSFSDWQFLVLTFSGLVILVLAIMELVILGLVILGLVMMGLAILGLTILSLAILGLAILGLAIFGTARSTRLRFHEIWPGFCYQATFARYDSYFMQYLENIATLSKLGSTCQIHLKSIFLTRVPEHMF